MKSIITKLSLVTLIIIFYGLITNVSAQPPRPPHQPPPGGEPIGGNAPIDGGLSVMLMLSAAYGAKKYLTKKED